MTMCSFPGNRSRADTAQAARPAGPDSACPPTVHPAQVQCGHQGGWGGVWRMRDRMSEHSPRAEESQRGRSPASPGPAGRSELPPHGPTCFCARAQLEAPRRESPRHWPARPWTYISLKEAEDPKSGTEGLHAGLGGFHLDQEWGAAVVQSKDRGVRGFLQPGGSPSAGVSLLWSRAVPGPACPGLFPGHLLQPRRRAQG